MFKKKKILAIIPARLGSKRIKNKNIIPFKGKPLIFKTLQVAKRCKYIDKLVVSSESKKILNICKSQGVNTPFLRKKAYDDYSSVQQATLSAIEQAEKFYGKFDVVIQLMVNCPLRKLSTLNKCIKNFFIKKKDSQISFFDYGFANPWWAHKIVKSKINPIYKKKLFQRSQDLEKLYCPTGSIWISKISTLKKYKTFYSPNYGYFLMNFKEALDIDNLEDLELAKRL